MPNPNDLMGWVKPTPSQQKAVLSELPIPYMSDVYSGIKDTGRNKVRLLSSYVKQLHGSFIGQVQVIGDCVSFGAAHAVDHTYSFEIAVRQEAEEWLGITSTEDIYGGSRIQIGNGQLGLGDGSIGSWAAKYVSQYGTLLRKKYDHDDLSVYSGERAKRWGNPGQGVPQYLIPIAKQTRIQTVTLVRSYNEARDSIYNGYAVTVASNVGFGSKRDKDGFLRPSGSWAHQMCFIGVDDEYYRKGLLCLNSWPYQWVSGTERYEMPPGSFWVDADVADRMLGQGDSFAYSDRLGFPAKKINLKVWV